MRQANHAPVMFAKSIGNNSYYVEAKDGSWKREGIHAHCINCAKGKGVVYWLEKFSKK
jgi:hypothetical protein